MKVSDIKTHVDRVIEEHGDLDLGDASEFSFFLHREGWICGWSERVIQRGFHWVNKIGAGFLGTEEHRLSKSGNVFGDRPREDELGPPETKTVRSMPGDKR